MKPTVETVKLTVVRGRIGSMSEQAITEFLEARICDDEAAVKNGGSYWDDCYGSECHDRMLAECAAKRAIILQAELASSDRSQVISEYCVGQAERDAEYATDPGKLILEALAAVYSDHPQYRQEWGL